MEFSIAANIDLRKKADLLVVPFWKKKKEAVLAAKEIQLGVDPKHLSLALHDFSASDSELLIVYNTECIEGRVALLNLGEQEHLTTESLRRAYAHITKTCNQKKWTSVNIVLPNLSNLAETAMITGIVEGLLLPNYTFEKHKFDTIKDNPSSLLKKVHFIGKKASKDSLALANKLLIISEGVYFARDLINGNADDINPQHLASIALSIAETHENVKATIFNKKRIEKEKMGLLLAVNRGSHTEPTFIILEYKGSPKAQEHVVMVGKGITYDTGGLNIKTAGMETMKCDMGGAATVLATLAVAAKLKLPVHLTAVVPATENAISSQSYKPGDVYAGYTGKTVEVANTDAEGRLVLADALAYADRNLKPTYLIDFATLTGGVDIALGNETTGFMSNNETLSQLLIQAGNETFERIWRLPLFEEYKKNIKSDVADIKNVGTRSASSIIGGIFLQYFVDKKTPWAHLDIASTAFLNETKRYLPKHATGVGVRLMIDFLQRL